MFVAPVLTCTVRLHNSFWCPAELSVQTLVYAGLFRDFREIFHKWPFRKHELRNFSNQLGILGLSLGRVFRDGGLHGGCRMVESVIVFLRNWYYLASTCINYALQENEANVTVDFFSLLILKHYLLRCVHFVSHHFYFTFYTQCPFFVFACFVGLKLLRFIFLFFLLRF